MEIKLTATGGDGRNFCQRAGLTSDQSLGATVSDTG